MSISSESAGVRTDGVYEYRDGSIGMFIRFARDGGVEAISVSGGADDAVSQLAAQALDARDRGRLTKEGPDNQLLAEESLWRCGLQWSGYPRRCPSARFP